MTMTEYVYQCRAGETFDLAALRIYGDEKSTPYLLAANPSLCGKMVFSGGEELNLPAIPTENAAEAAPWKE